MKIIEQKNQINKEEFSEYIGKVIHCNHCEANIEIEKSDLDYMWSKDSVTLWGENHPCYNECFLRCIICGNKIISKTEFKGNVTFMDWKKIGTIKL